MAIEYYASINLNKNELQGAALQNLSTKPDAPAKGQIFFDTDTNQVNVCTAAETSLGANDEVWEGLVSEVVDATTITQTTSILNTSLVVGRDAADQIKFSTDAQIIFRVDGGDNVIFKASGEIASVSDGAKISFGANSEIALTHVHDTGLKLTDSGGSPTLQFHDANEAVSSDGSKLILTSNGVAYSMPTADGTSGYQLTTDGSGTLSWAASTTATAADDITAGDSGVSITTSSGNVLVDSEAGTTTVDGHTGVVIQSSNSGDVDITSAAVIDITATTGIEIDGTTVSIDGTDDSNLTVTGSGKDLDIAVAGGSAQELRLASAGTGASALHLNASAGSVDIDSHDNVTIDANDEITLTTGSADGHITLHSAHTAGVAILIDANHATGSILDIDAGIMDVDVQGAYSLDASGISLDSDAASNFTTSSGALTLTSAAAATWSTSAGNLTLDSAAGTLVLDGHTGVNIDASNSGKVAIDGAGGIDIGVATDVAIDIDSTTLDIDASDAITIDSTSTIVISGDGGATFSDDTEAIIYDGSGNLDIDAVALDMDTSGAINIAAAGTASDITISTAHTAGVAFHIDANAHASSEVQIDAGILDIDVTGASTIDTTLLTLTSAGGLTIKDSTASSGTEGGHLILASDDGAAMADDHRLGVIEFKGAEDASNTLVAGAKIQALADAGWSATENGTRLEFYTMDGNASSELSLTLDSDKLATFAGAVTITGNLTVNGTTTTVDSTTLTVADPLIKLNKGDTASPARDQGLIISRGDGSSADADNRAFLWDETADKFIFADVTTEDGTTVGNVSINAYSDIKAAALIGSSAVIGGGIGDTGVTITAAGNISADGKIITDNTTNATSTTNGSIQTDGGLSVVLDAVIGDDLVLLSDASVIHFGADKEITLTHVADVGLTITNTNTGDNKPVILQLKSEENEIIADETIASLEFAAGDTDGGDGATVAAGIHAIAEGTFSDTANATKLVFTTGSSETAANTATAKMTLNTDGALSTAGSITAVGSFIIGSADMSEADLEKLDGITNGTAAASKALVVDSNKDIGTLRNLTIDGVFTDGNYTFDTNGNVSGLGTVASGAITSSGIIKTDDTTDATSTTDGSLQTDGGLSVAKDVIAGNDVYLLNDDAVLGLGAGKDATLTHDGTTGLTIAATPISIDSTGELHLNSTTGDIKLQDGGTDQITFDLDGTAGDVIMKAAVDGDDLVIQQYDGTEVIRIEDNASLGLVGNKLNIANSSSDVVIKPLTDGKDIIFQQYDGTAVATVEDNATFNIAKDAHKVVALIEVGSITHDKIVTIPHNLGTADIMVQMYDVVTEANVHAAIARTSDDFSSASTSSVSIDFGTTTPPNNIRVLITSFANAQASGTVTYT